MVEKNKKRIKFRRNGIMVVKNKDKIKFSRQICREGAILLSKRFCLYVWENLICVHKIFNDPGTEN